MPANGKEVVKVTARQQVLGVRPIRGRQRPLAARIASCTDWLHNAQCFRRQIYPTIVSKIKFAPPPICEMRSSPTLTNMLATPFHSLSALDGFGWLRVLFAMAASTRLLPCHSFTLPAG